MGVGDTRGSDLGIMKNRRRGYEVKVEVEHCGTRAPNS